MKTTSITRIITLCITLLPVHINAFIYLARVFQSKDKLYIGLSDFHETEYALNRVGDQQRYELLKWAYMLRAALIIEDMAEESAADMPNDPRKFLANLDPLVLMNVNDKGTALAYLYSYCKELNIPFTNCEFRQAATDSFYKETVPYYFALKELGRLMNEVNRYNDSPGLNAIYKREYANLDKLLQANKKFFDLFVENKSLSLYEFMHNEENFTIFKDEIERFITYYESAAHPLNHLAMSEQIYTAVNHYADNLLEVKMMHAAYNQKSQVVIFYAGGFHIYKIAEYFKQVGYTELLWFVDETRLENEPKAIDIDDSLKKISRLLPTLQIRKEVPLLLYEILYAELKKTKMELCEKEKMVLPATTAAVTMLPKIVEVKSQDSCSHGLFWACNVALSYAIVHTGYSKLSFLKKISLFLGLMFINGTLYFTIPETETNSST